MRDILHCFAEIVAAAFLLNDAFENLTGAQAVVLGEDATGETFVVAEIEVGFGAIIQDIDLAVLVRRHRARVDIEVGVELLEHDLEAAAFQKRSE